MSNVQVVNLADNINAAVLKINQNFAGVDAGDIGGGLDSSEVVGVITETVDSAYVNNLVDIPDAGVDSSVVNNIVNNILDSDYFITVINQDYLNQFTINTDVSHLDSDISANTSAIFQLTSQINDSDNGLLALSQAIIATQSQVDGLVLDGFDSDALISAVTSANSQVISRIEATENNVTILSGVLDSVEAQLIIIDSDLGVRIDAEANARNILSSTVTAQGGTITTLSQDVTALDNAVFIRDSDGNITSTALASAENALSNQITQVDGRITTVEAGLTTDLQAYADGVGASVTNTLEAYVDAATGNTTASWNLDLTAGDTNNPYVAGIKFGNDGASADFVLSADTFQLVTPTDSDGTGGISPFTVSAIGVELSNETVTGAIVVTTSSGTGSMNIKGELITISDGNGTPRIKLGDLSA